MYVIVVLMGDVLLDLFFGEVQEIGKYDQEDYDLEVYFFLFFQMWFGSLYYEGGDILCVIFDSYWSFVCVFYSFFLKWWCYGDEFIG